LVGVAVKVAEDPAHIGLLPEVKAIATEGTSTGFTVIVILALVAVVGLAHDALEVIMHVTVWPWVKPAAVYMVLLVPTFTPSTCH